MTEKKDFFGCGERCTSEENLDEICECDVPRYVFEIPFELYHPRTGDKVVIRESGGGPASLIGSKRKESYIF